MRVFTIKGYPSMPGRLQVTGPAGNRGRSISRDANDAGEAAAIALDWALSSGDSYVIVGQEAAMKHIPENLRSRK